MSNMGVCTEDMSEQPDYTFGRRNFTIISNYLTLISFGTNFVIYKQSKWIGSSMFEFLSRSVHILSGRSTCFCCCNRYT